MLSLLTTAYSALNASMVKVGGSHSCALLSDDSLVCWGSNSAGQLGLGVSGNVGDFPGQMGDKITATDVGTGCISQ
jgi:alpha-tubulin suppressor-like RCC1 family protein